MPVTVKPEGDKFRVVNADTGKPETNAAGTAVDGGGHDTERDARAQAEAINARKGVRAEFADALKLGLPGFLTSAKPDEVKGLAMTIRTGEPMGPFPGVSGCPVPVLEMLPTRMLAGMGKSQHLYWVPIELEAGGEVTAAKEEAELVTSETEGHTHRYSAGASKTGPREPAKDGDSHTHPIVAESGEVGEANEHTHRRDPAELADPEKTLANPTIPDPTPSSV